MTKTKLLQEVKRTEKQTHKLLVKAMGEGQRLNEIAKSADVNLFWLQKFSQKKHPDHVSISNIQKLHNGLVK